MSRYIWNPEDEHLHGGSDFDDMTDTGSVSCSSSSYSNMQDEDVRITIEYNSGLNCLFAWP